MRQTYSTITKIATALMVVLAAGIFVLRIVGVIEQGAALNLLLPAAALIAVCTAAALAVTWLMRPRANATNNPP